MVWLRRHDCSLELSLNHCLARRKILNAFLVDELNDNGDYFSTQEFLD